MLLHDGSKSEDAIHGFFKEAYELYVKVRSTLWTDGSLGGRECGSPPLLVQFMLGVLLILVPIPPQPPPTKPQLIMNPFFEFDKPVVSPAFDARIRALEKRYLR